MKPTFVFALTFSVALLTAPVSAMADEWTGPDKTLHFAGGALIGASASLVMSKPKAAALGIAVGALKEAADYRSRARGGHHDPSARDFAATAAGAVFGAYVPGLILQRRSISYSWSF